MVKTPGSIWIDHFFVRSKIIFFSELQKIQNAALCLPLNLPYRTKNINIHNQANIDTFFDFSKRISLIYWKNAKTPNIMNTQSYW